MDLTTLQRVKDYLAGVGVTNTGADTLYSALISRASDMAIQWTGRPFQRASMSQRLNGTGSTQQMLPENPIISVSSLVIDGATIPVSPDAMASGYQFDNKFVYLFGGYYFNRGMRNVAISYVAGFSTTQTSFIPANPGPYTITPVTGSGSGPDGGPMSTGGPALLDRGVTFVATGVALVLVGSNPAAGQYAFSGGVYTFAAADAGKQVTMSYDFCPGAVEQAVLEMVGTKMKQRDNLGIASKSLANETITFLDKDLSNSVKGLLGPYRYMIKP